MSSTTSRQYYKDLIIELVKKEMKVRYKSSFLGYLWSVIAPLSQALVYFFAFKYIMRVQIENYVLFLVVGLFPWQWLSNSIAVSSTTIIANASLIKKTVFPREYIVFAGVLNDLIHFLLALPVILLFFAIYKHGMSLNILLILPLLIVIQFLLTTGVSLFVAAVNVFFRDLERLVIILINFLFYATPVIYSETMLPQKFHFITYVNPAAPLIISYRNLFLHGTVNWNYILVALGYSVVIYGFGLYVFKKLKWRFAEVL